jgi:PIN domain nuclease of toxin-antitoxin system
VRLLADTQCWLWMHLAPERFSARTRRMLRNPETDVILSVASIWEIAIKHGLGKLRLPEPVERWVPSRVQIGQTTLLPVEAPHALRIAGLPPLHRDPFDRMIVAQALVENVPVLTADAALGAYGIKVIAA